MDDAVDEDGWPIVPDPPPDDPYDPEDHYCLYCGNGSWKLHAPWCKWADRMGL